MTSLEHPSARLDPEVARLLSAFAQEAEMAGDLHPKQLSMLYDHKWFKMFIPKNYGGLGLTLPEAVRLEEALAWADGSAAWVATLCGGAGWFVGFVDKSIADEFFVGDKLCVAGSGSATGTAGITNDGYVINGLWPYASGSLHATTFTANCVIHDQGKALLNADGTLRIMPFILKPCEVVVKKTWNATGMVATASHSFSVSNVNVPAKRCFEIDPSAATINDPVYRFPFLPLAGTTLVANVAGMTQRFLDLAIDSVSEHESSKGMSTCEVVVRKHESTLNNVRRLFFRYLDEAWQQLLVTGVVPVGNLQEVSLTCHELARTCREAVDEIYPLCGMKVLLAESERNRVWRNIHMALSHSLFRNRSAAGNS
ncbi:MAG TPA: acyl-CoA dehydrogenase family protein [Chryseolinea sp.]|nr:acyl-CoA dehydrogenase family protein [Chryseolinea sp.]